MTAHSKIVEISRSTSDPAPSETLPESPGIDEPLFADGSTAEDYWEDAQEAIRPWGRILLTSTLLLAALGWTGFFLWAHFSELLSLSSPIRASQLVTEWAGPIAIIALAWLLALRMSSAEARRFGNVARLLQNESEALEQRMRTVNGEIALARSFLAENAKELESVGRLSAKRLTEAADRLNTALHDSDERATMLQTASTAAVTNLEQLRNHLPVVTSAAKDATNQIGIAGNTAHGQIKAIVETLHAMDASAVEASNALVALNDQVGTSTTTLESRLTEASEHLSLTVQNSQERASTLISDLSAGVNAAEQRLVETASDLDTRMSASHQRLEANLGSLSEAIAHLEAVGDAQDSSSKALLQRVKASILECREEAAKFGDDASDQIAKLAFAVSALNERGDELDARLIATRANTESLIGTTEEMRTGLGTLADETDAQLIPRIEQMAGIFAEAQQSFASLNSGLAAAETGTGSLIQSVTALEQLISTQSEAVAQIGEQSSAFLSAQHEQVDILSASIVHTRSALEELSGIANEQLVASLLRVRETTKQAAEASRKIVDEELTDISDKMNESGSLAIQNAVEQQAIVLEAAMREAFDRNLALASDVEDRIARQLRLVDEMATNLEQRVNEAHTSFAGADDDSFARRMALLTESLNSAAIDVAKILSNEVTDTAWAAYLKGDRGIFTRRAVRLLDSGEAKIIAAHYDEDAEFREHVNRYIHDFESMMRVLLSTRDGNAIGVTLLSSDVGKLYVALAQAIERLRN